MASSHATAIGSHATHAPTLLHAIRAASLLRHAPHVRTSAADGTQPIAEVKVGWQLPPSTPSRIRSTSHELARVGLVAGRREDRPFTRRTEVGRRRVRGREITSKNQFNASVGTRNSRRSFVVNTGKLAQLFQFNFGWADYGFDSSRSVGPTLADTRRTADGL